MPRPADGYRNSAGDKVPGVHDPFKAFLSKEALNGYYYNRGKRGLPMREPGIFGIGHAVHAMCELELRGRPFTDIEAEVAKLDSDADRDKAWAAFEAFRAWRAELGVRAVAHEVSIVSDTLQLGGTPDAIAVIDGDYVLIDFKTCNHVPDTPYNDHPLAAAAHAKLWNEAHPDRKVVAAYVVYLPKDGSAPGCHVITDLAGNWLVYWHLLRAYQRRFGFPNPVLPPDPRDAEIACLRAALEAQMMVKPKRKPRAPTVATSPKRAWEDQRANVVSFPGRAP